MKIWHAGFGMGQFAETLREVIPFEQRRHSRTLSANEASILTGCARQRAKSEGYQAAQVKA